MNFNYDLFGLFFVSKVQYKVPVHRNVYMYTTTNIITKYNCHKYKFTSVLSRMPFSDWLRNSLSILW